MVLVSAVAVKISSIVVILIYRGVIVNDTSKTSKYVIQGRKQKCTAIYGKIFIGNHFLATVSPSSRLLAHEAP
jgi:hypothetical protein